MKLRSSISAIGYAVSCRTINMINSVVFPAVLIAKLFSLYVVHIHFTPPVLQRPEHLPVLVEI